MEEATKIVCKIEASIATKQRIIEESVKSLYDELGNMTRAIETTIGQRNMALEMEIKGILSVISDISTKKDELEESMNCFKENINEILNVNENKK